MTRIASHTFGSFPFCIPLLALCFLPPWCGYTQDRPQEHIERQTEIIEKMYDGAESG